MQYRPLPSSRGWCVGGRARMRGGDRAEWNRQGFDSLRQETPPASQSLPAPKAGPLRFPGGDKEPHNTYSRQRAWRLHNLLFPSPSLDIACACSKMQIQSDQAWAVGFLCCRGVSVQCGSSRGRLRWRTPPGPRTGSSSRPEIPLPIAPPTLFLPHSKPTRSRAKQRDFPLPNPCPRQAEKYYRPSLCVYLISGPLLTVCTGATKSVLSSLHLRAKGGRTDSRCRAPSRPTRGPRAPGSPVRRGNPTGLQKLPRRRTVRRVPRRLLCRNGSNRRSRTRRAFRR